VALDEAYSLFTAEIEGDEMNGGRYYAFHRIISLFKGSLRLVCISLHGIYNSNGPDYQLCTLPPSPINPSARMRLDSDTVALRLPQELQEQVDAFRAAEPEPAPDILEEAAGGGRAPQVRRGTIRAAVRG
jgi:hypothetical protein